MIRLHIMTNNYTRGVGYMLNIDFMVGMVVLIVVIGFVWHTFYNKGGWDD